MAGGSRDLQPLGTPRPGRCRGVDQPECPALETDRPNRRVLGLNAGMADRCGETGHTLDRRHQIAKQIDHVDRLVRQRPAAIQRTGPVPVGIGVIGHLPPPGNEDAPVGQCPETPFGEGLADRFQGALVADLEDAAQPGSCRRVGGDHPVDPFGREFERLLAEDMLSRPSGGERRLEVRPGRRGDDQHIHLR